MDSFLLVVSLTIGALVLMAVAALVYLFANRYKFMKRAREGWEAGAPLRDPDGKFNRAPTLAEARQFAGARGEPSKTCEPVILPDGYEDAIDESARLNMRPYDEPRPLTAQPPGGDIPPPTSGEIDQLGAGVASRWKPGN